jgi:hypothetical protein
MALCLDSSKRPPPLGAIEPGVEIATESALAPVALSPFTWFFVAVAAGVTTWWLTSMLSKSRR